MANEWETISPPPNDDEKRLLEEFMQFQMQDDGWETVVPAAASAQDSGWETVSPAEETAKNPDAAILPDIATQLPVGAARGTLNTMETLTELNARFADWMPSWARKAQSAVREFIGLPGEDAELVKTLQGAKEALPEAETTAGKIADVTGQVLAPMGAINKGLKTAGLANVWLRGALSGTITDFSVFDKEEGNLSNIIQENPSLANPVNEFLAIDKDDDKIEAGLKQAAEGILLGGAVDSFMKGVKIVKSWRMAKKQAARAAKYKPMVEEAISRYEEIGYGREEAAKRAMRALKLDEKEFISLAPAESKVDLSGMSLDDLKAKAKEMGIDPADYENKGMLREAVAKQEDAFEVFGDVTAQKAPRADDIKTIKEVEEAANMDWIAKQERAQQLEAPFRDKEMIQPAPGRRAMRSQIGAINTDATLQINKDKGMLDYQKDIAKSYDFNKQPELPLGDMQAIRPGQAEVLTEAGVKYPHAPVDKPFKPIIGQQIDMALQGGGTLRKEKLMSAVENAIKRQQLQDAARTEKVAKLVDKEIKRTNSMLSGNVATRAILGVRERIAQISPRIAHTLNRYEQDLHVAKLEARHRIQPFIKTFNKMSKADKAQLTKLLRAEDETALNTFLSNKQEMSDAFKEVGALLKEFKAAGEELGAFTGREGFYFPRVVKDHKGLLNALGYKHRTELEKQIAALGKEADINQISDTINKYLRTKVPEVMRAGKTSHMRERAIPDIVEGVDISKYYADPIEAIDHYIGTMSDNLAKRKFFGYTKKSGVTDEMMRDKNFLKDSAGKKFAEEYAAGRITASDLDQVQGLLAARFGSGEKSPTRLIQSAKNYMYMSILANPVSSVTQLGDVFLANHVNGLGDTLYGLYKALSPRGGLTKESVGIAQYVEDMNNSLKSHRMLDKAMRVSLFSASDNLGKASLINGSLRKYSRMAKTQKGLDDIVSQYKDAFTPQEMQQVIGDLQAGRITPNVKYMLWNDLTKMQPVTLSEMPEMYLNHPQGRVFYALKTFTVKQLNRMYFDGIRKIQQGNVTEGMKGLMSFAALLTAGGMTTDTIKDMMMNREPMDFDERFISNMYKVAGTSDFVANMIKEGDIAGAVTATIAPPIAPFGTALAKDLAKLQEDPSQFESLVEWKSFGYVPLIGKIGHAWWGGGAEKYNERLQKMREEE